MQSFIEWERAPEAPKPTALIGIQLTGDGRSRTIAQNYAKDEADQRSAGGHRGFETARRKADQIFISGRTAEASQALIDALEEEDGVECNRRKAYEKLRLRFLEEAVHYDQRAKCAEAAVGKLREIAGIVDPSDQITYLRSRAARYHEIGKVL